MKKLLIALLLTGGTLSLPLFGAEASRDDKPILNAIIAGNLQKVRNELANEGFLDINSPAAGGTNRSLLRHAIHQLSQSIKARKAIIKALVEAGASVGTSWQRVPQKGIYDIELIDFLINHPTTSDNSRASVQRLSGVPPTIRDAIKRLIKGQVPRMMFVPPGGFQRNEEPFETPGTGAPGIG